MIWAVRNNERVMATKGAKALCPSCRNQVIPKCGQIKIHHWAHLVCECDSFKHGETLWHYRWKQRFPKEMQEVILKYDTELHRADIYTGSRVIEFQKSSISSNEIKAREMFYGNMIWVLDGSDFSKNFYVRDKGNYETFRWKWPRASWAFAKCPVFVDFESEMFEVKKIYPSTPCGGWGITWGLAEFYDWAKN